MNHREQLGWSVSAEVYDTFRDEFGPDEREITWHVQRAMREWIDYDTGATVEKELQELLGAYGSGEEGPKKDSAETRRSLPSRDSTVTVNRRISVELVDAFREFVHEVADTSACGVELEAALYRYLTANRAERLLAKVRRLRDALAETGTSGVGEIDTATSDLTGRDEKADAVAAALGRSFTRDELEETIEAVADVHSRPSIRTYTDLVLDRRNVVKHPKAGRDLWVPPEDAPDTDPSPADRYEDLARDEKVQILREELLDRARSGSAPRLTVDGAAEVFGGKPTDGHVSSLLDDVAEADGFGVDTRRGYKRATVTSQTVAEGSADRNAHSNGSVDMGHSGTPDTTMARDDGFPIAAVAEHLRDEHAAEELHNRALLRAALAKTAGDAVETGDVPEDAVDKLHDRFTDTRLDQLAASAERTGSSGEGHV